MIATVGLRQWDTCDGDDQCHYCSVEFKLKLKCDSDQTLDVASLDLPVVAVDLVADIIVFDPSEQQRGQELRLHENSLKGYWPGP